MRRRGHEIGAPVEELERRALDATVGPRSRGLPRSTGAEPVGGRLAREHGAAASDAAVWTADHGEPLERKRRPRTVPQRMLETPKGARHVVVDERDPDAGVGIPCHGADCSREERFQGRSAPTWKIRP